MMEINSEKWENQIRQLALELDYPPTPDIAASVRQRLAAQQPADQRDPFKKPWYAGRLAWVMTAVLLLAALLIAVPQTRAALIEFFQIGDIRLFPDEPVPTPEESSAVDGVPEPTETADPPPTATPLADSTPAPNPFANLYGRTTFAELEATFDDAVLLPEYPKGIGLPDEVYYQDALGRLGIQVWYKTAEQSEVFAVLYTLILDEGAFGGKASFQMSSMTVTKVNGQEAFWVQGEHMLRFYDESGAVEPRLTRFIEGNTLIWTEGEVTYRLETRLSLEEAIQMAESMR